jgi:hypothetical protein
LNVVEEMAIASSLPVPQVYVLEQEKAINAFAAGMTPGDAVIGVTRGTLDRLSRDELQGVVAHELGHVMNGDMRLNLRLMGLVHGLLLMVIAGRIILGVLRHVRGGGGKKGGGGAVAIIACAGLALLVLGSIGYFLGRLIQAATSREREHLADASAVQFTRNPEGLAGALRKILGHGSRVRHERAAEASHLFFAKAMGALSTHPPLEARLDRLDPGWRDRPLREPAPVEEPARRPAEAPSGGPFGGRGGTPFPMPVPAPIPMPFPVPGGRLPASLAASLVGRLDVADPAQGERVVASLPPEVLEACRDPFSARAAVLAVVADRHPERAADGWEALGEAADPALVAEAERLHDEVASLGPDATLSVVLLALPALRQMSGTQRDDFLAALRALAASDGVVTLQEHAIAELAALHMGAWPRADLPPPEDRRRAATLDLLGVLARSGSRTADAAARAFALGCRELGFVAALPPARPSPFETFHRAVRVLRSARAADRGRIVSAAAWTASQDGVLDPTESALLRLVADALECPIPLIAPTPPAA